MSRISVVLLAGAALAALAALGAAVGQAQLASLVGPDKVQIIYEGDLVRDSGGITITPWGSGKAESVQEQSYIGPEVLKVTSQGPYQGIVLHLNRPVEIEEFLQSGHGYLDLRLLPAQVRRTREMRERARDQRGRAAQPGAAGAGARAGAGAGMRGGMGAGGGGMRGGMGAGGGGMRGGMGAGGAGGAGMRGGMGVGGGGMRGGMGAGGAGAAGMRGGMGGGPGMRGGAGGMRAPGAAPPAAQPTRPATTEERQFNLRNLRVVLFTDKGQLVADSVSVGELPRDGRGWVPAVASLARFRGAVEGSTVRAVGVFADEADSFYLGQVRLVVDRSPVTVELNAAPAVARTGQVIEFTVGLRGGPIEPQTAWDFGDGDEPREQAFGRRVRYVYGEPGHYRVTATVRDRSGARPPIVRSMGVRVEAPR